MSIRQFPLIALLLGLALLAGCRDDAGTAERAPAQAIEEGDSCHVCGMLIAQFPGPKGQAFPEGREAPLKFCSTAEMFGFLLQPENATQLSHAYVHDIGVTTWDTPADEAFIPAESAWYVAGHDRRGSMGHTLASFAERSDAETFRDDHGGKVLAFEEIDLALLGRLGRGELGAGEDVHGAH